MVNPKKTCAKISSAKTVAQLEAMLVKALCERLQIVLIDFRHQGQQFKCYIHVWVYLSKFFAAHPIESKESEHVALHLAACIGMFAVPGILHCDNGTEFQGACDHLVKNHGLPVVHSKPRTCQQMVSLKQQMEYYSHGFWHG